MNRRFLLLTLCFVLLAFGYSFTIGARSRVESNTSKVQLHSFDQTKREEQVSRLKVVAKLNQRPGNIAVTPEERLIISLHPFGKPEYRVVEVLPDGRLKPFPNEQWSRAPGKDGIGLDAVIGIQADRNSVVWMLDMGGVNGSLPKIVAWNTRRNELARVIYIPPPTTISNSFQQDLAVDLVHEVIYIADMTRADLIGVSKPAIVVVDLKTGASRRVLEGDTSVVPENVPMVVDNKVVKGVAPDGKPFEPRLGLNPITIDPASKWVYYGSVHGTSVYRIRTKDLLDTKLSAADLAKRVERYGDKAVSDGISIDGAGNIYVTDVGNNAIGVVEPSGKYRTLIKDDAVLSWPDGMSYGPDGFFYVTVNQLHRTPVFNGGKDVSKPPYLIVRFKPLAPSAVGR